MGRLLFRHLFRNSPLSTTLSPGRVGIGVVGYSGQKFDTEHATNLLDVGLMALVQLAIRDFGIGSKIEIVSGLTALGIPLLAYEWAAKHGFDTVGIACKKAIEFPQFDVTERIIMGEEWGDESPTFLSRCDLLLKVGGGNQSKREFSTYAEGGRHCMNITLPALPA